MNISYLSQLLKNYVPVTGGAGEYNVQVMVRDPNVQLCVVANPPQNLDYIAVFAQSPNLQSLANSIHLPADGGFYFFTVLVPYQVPTSVSADPRKIIFGMGAGVKGSGQPAEVAEFSISASESTGLTSLQNLGGFIPTNHYWGSFTVPLDEISPPPTNTKPNLSIKASSFNVNSELFESGAVVLLLNSNGIVYAWDSDKNAADEVIIPTNNLSSYKLIALVKGSPDTDGFTQFSVGDPEKDGKAKIVKV